MLQSRRQRVARPESAAMTRTFYTIEPFDTTAFRDGRPFEQDDQGLAETVSVFPPPPPAIAGAVMVALAEAIDVPAGEDWGGRLAELEKSPGEVEKARGRDLARILETQITGPFLARWDGDKRWDWLAPCPADLLFRIKDGEPEEAVGFIRPSEATVCANIAGTCCQTQDLGRAFPPSKKPSAEDDVKLFPGCFMTFEAIDQYLRNGRIPILAKIVSPDKLCVTEIVPPAELYATEPRIGIEVEKSKGTAKASRLYAAKHQRLKSVRARPGCYFYYAAEGPRLESLGEKQIDCVAPFGGEGRFARIRGPYDAPQAERLVDGAVERFDDAHVGARITALTPVPVTHDKSWGLDLALASSLGDAQIIGAAHERPRSVGFIQRADHKKGKMRVIRVFPAGSTWFLKVPAEKGAEKRVIEAIVAGAEAGRLAAADLALYGFGRFLAGKS